MKTVAKVFTIIGMITGFWSILPLIFGAIALKKLKNDQVTVGTGVCTLLFVNVVAGIMMLVMPKGKTAEAVVEPSVDEIIAEESAAEVAETAPVEAEAVAEQE